MRSLDAYNDVSRRRHQEIAQLATRDELPLDQDAVSAVEAVLAALSRLSQAPPPSEAHGGEQRRRVAVQLAAACRLAFDWRSPALAQAGVLSVGEVAALGSGRVNYARYDQPGIDAIERSLARELGVDDRTHVVLATSSGMAALSVILAVLGLRGRLRRVLTAPGIYFEAHEALGLFGPDATRVASGCDAQLLADEAAAWGADAVLADPLANATEQRLVNVASLAAALAQCSPQSLLVVDGTMVPLPETFGALRALPDRALYYESCSKYRHLGLDVTLAGMVVVPRCHEAAARRARQNLGAGPDRFGCEVWPIVDGGVVARRFRAMERSATVVAERLAGAGATRWVVRHPGLPTHPDHALAMRMGFVGASVTLEPVAGDGGLRRVGRLAERAIEVAARSGVPLVHGESFGFTASRLSTTLQGSDLPPFARLSVGPIGTSEAGRLADVFRQALAEA